MTVKVNSVVLFFLPSFLRHVADADARLVVEDGAHALAVGDGRVGRAAEVDDEGLVRLGRAGRR